MRRRATVGGIGAIALISYPLFVLVPFVESVDDAVFRHVVAVKVQCLEGIKSRFLQALVNSLFQIRHVARGDGVGLADDWYHRCLALQCSEYLNVKVFVQRASDTIGQDSFSRACVHRPLFLSRLEIGVQTNRIENEKDTMDVSILYTGRADHLGLFQKGFFEFILDEAADIAKLKVNHVLLQSLRVPQRQTNPFPIDVGLEVVVDKVPVRLAGASVLLPSLPTWSRLCSKGAAEEVEEGGLPGIPSSNDENTGPSVSARVTLAI